MIARDFDIHPVQVSEWQRAAVAKKPLPKTIPGYRGGDPDDPPATSFRTSLACALIESALPVKPLAVKATKKPPAR